MEGSLATLKPVNGRTLAENQCPLQPCVRVFQFKSHTCTNMQPSRKNSHYLARSTGDRIIGKHESVACRCTLSSFLYLPHFMERKIVVFLSVHCGLFFHLLANDVCLALFTEALLMNCGGGKGGDEREGAGGRKHIDLPFIENNGAKMAPIGFNISQVAVHLSPSPEIP